MKKCIIDLEDKNNFLKNEPEELNTLLEKYYTVFYDNKILY